MKQTWHDLLFAHWPIPPEHLRPSVPPELPLDTFDGKCWVGVVPFRMSGIRARWTPPIPGLSSLPELNVRTYVIHKGKPGVYFFSLDAASHAAVWGARTFYHLPYFYAQMKSTDKGGVIHYNSTRKDKRMLRFSSTPPPPEDLNAQFRGTYRPIGSVREKSTLEHFLTERYCLYTLHQAKLYCCDIHHQPWPLQNAEALIEQNTVAAAAGVDLPNAAPLLHFVKRLEVLIWPLRRAD